MPNDTHSTGSPLGANDGGGDLSKRSQSKAAKSLGGRKSEAGGRKSSAKGRGKGRSKGGRKR